MERRPSESIDMKTHKPDFDPGEYAIIQMIRDELGVVLPLVEDKTPNIVEALKSLRSMQAQQPQAEIRITKIGGKN